MLPPKFTVVGYKAKHHSKKNSGGLEQYWWTFSMGVKGDPTVKSGACTLYMITGPQIPPDCQQMLNRSMQQDR